MKRALIAAGLYVTLLRGGNGVLGLAVAIVLTRFLGPSDYGLYAYAVTCLALAAVPIGRAWSTVLLRAAAENQLNGRWSETKGLAIRGYQAAAITALLLLIIAVSVDSLMPTILPDRLSITVFVGLSAVLLFDQVSALQSAILRGLDHPVIGQIPEMALRPLIIIVAVLLFARLGNEQSKIAEVFIALSVAALTSSALGRLFLRWKSPKKLSHASAHFQTRRWISITLPLATSAGLIIMNSYIDILILGFFVDLADVGVYRVAVQVSLLSGLAYTGLNMIASQRFASLLEARDMKGLQETAAFMARIAFACALPLPLALILGGHYIVPFVFGESFASAVFPMIVLAIAQVFSSAIGMPRTLLVMGGMEKRVATYTAIAVVSNIALCVGLIPAFGIDGAAVATATVTVLWNLALWAEVRREFSLNTSVL